MSGQEERRYRGLRTYKSEADFELMWESIEAIRYPEKRRRKVLWWFAGGMGFSLLFAVLAYPYLSTQSIDVLAGDDSELEQVRSADIVEGGSTVLASSTSTTARAVQQQNRYNDADIFTGEPLQVNEASSSLLASSTLPTTRVVQPQSMASTTVVKSDKKTSSLVFNSLVDWSSDQSLQSSPTMLLDDQISVLSQPIFPRSLSAIERLPMLSFWVTTIAHPLPMVDQILPIQPYIEPVHQKRNALTINYAYGRQVAQLSAASSSQEGWLQYRRDLERHLDVQQIGITYSRTVNDRLSLSLGVLGYLRTGLTEIQTDEQSQTIALGTVVGTRELMDGTIVDVLGAAQGESQFLITDKVYNRQMDIDVSLSLSYRIGTHWSINGGANVSLWSLDQGRVVNVIDATSRYVDLNDLTANRLQWSPIFGLSYDLQLTSRWALGIGVHSRWQLDNNYQSDFVQRPIDIMTRMGLTYAW